MSRRALLVASFLVSAGLGCGGGGGGSTTAPDDDGGADGTLGDAGDDGPPADASTDDAALDTHRSADGATDGTDSGATTDARPTPDGAPDGGSDAIAPDASHGADATSTSAHHYTGLGAVHWLDEYSGLVLDGHLTPTPGGELRMSVDWWKGVDFGDGVVRGSSPPSGHPSSALLHLSVTGDLLSVHEDAPLRMPLSEIGGLDFARHHGFGIADGTLRVWDLERLQTLATDDTATTFGTPPGVEVLGASFADGTTAVTLRAMSGPITWGGVTVPDVYALVRLDAAGAPLWAKQISSSLTLSLYPVARPLTDATGTTYLADWVLAPSGQWTYDGSVRGTVPAGSKGAFLFAADPTGAMAWGKTLVSAHAEAVTGTRPFAMALDAGGHLVVAAWADVDLGAGPYGTSDDLAFVRLDAVGAPTLLAKILAPPIVERAGLAFRADGSFLFTGTYATVATPWSIGGETFACSGASTTCGVALSFGPTGAPTSASALTGCATDDSRFDAPRPFGGGWVFDGRSFDCTLGSQHLATTAPESAVLAVYLEP